MLLICLILLVFQQSTAYDNIAVNKTAWQLHPYIPGEDRFDASNAVDGRKSDLRGLGGQCVVSAGGHQTATWRVDLGDILSIHHITIYYRTDNVAWDASNGYTSRFLGFSLYLSNTTNNTDGKLCFRDENYTKDTIPAVVNVTCPVHGRYVIYYNERKQGVIYPSGYSTYAFNELCELEVYAQAFCGATSLSYTDELSSEKVVIPSRDGIFRTPEGGWAKEGRKYFVIQGKEAEPTRNEKIMQIMKQIREQKAHVHPQKRKIEAAESEERYTRNRNPKMRVGWRHFKNGRFKQVFYKDGGGVREVSLPSLELNVDAVILLAKEVLFPNGECKYGDINQMEMWLGDYAGEKLTSFESQGNKKCLGKYLKDQGLHLSRCTFYLMTQEKNASSASTSTSISETSSKHTGRVGNQDSSKVDDLQDKSFSDPNLVPILSGVVCEKQSISIQYAQENTSKYDGEKSLIKFHSISQCRNITSFTEYIDDDEDYNPCLHGFFISRIRIGQKCFLDCSFERNNAILEKHITFPSSNRTGNLEGIIIHEPVEIWGYDGNKLVLGVVAAPAENARYEWFKDNIPVDKGESSLYIVKEHGMYACQVSYASVQQMSKPIQIISVSEGGCLAFENDTRYVVQTLSVNASLPESTTSNVAEGIPNSKKAKTESSVPEVTVDDLHIDYSTALGSGAFGTVYKGKWAGSVVAVKALTVAKRNRSTMLEMVEKEIDISSKIRHPNIVLFLAVARAPSTIYLVHEYIDGCNMEDAIFDQETKKLMEIKPEHKLFILRQRVQGVAYLHALDPPVIHQDIKPSNIMIKKICHTTKLCDLGVSRVKSVRAASMCTTQMGTAFGTPSYMAPECLLYNEKTCVSSDIWSLGVTMVEFAMEEDAWSVDNELDTVGTIRKKMARKDPPIPCTDAIGIPTKVMDTIKRCVNHEKILRPTAEDVLHVFSD